MVRGTLGGAVEFEVGSVGTSLSPLLGVTQHRTPIRMSPHPPHHARVTSTSQPCVASYERPYILSLRVDEQAKWKLSRNSTVIDH